MSAPIEWDGAEMTRRPGWSLRAAFAPWRAWMVLLVGTVLALQVAGVSAQNVETVLMPGKLIAGHAKYEDDCTQCHVRFDKNAQSRLCAGCHKEVGADIQSKKGYHGRLADTACRRCHTDHKGREAVVVQLDRDRFDHDKTDFPLRGGHTMPRAKCASCHLPKVKFRDAPSQCQSCHRKDDVHKGGLGAQCEKCHSERDWKSANFDHDQTRFRLEDKHRGVSCEACHKDARYKETPRECAGCHRDDDMIKGHKGRFGNRCASCHNVRSWKESSFNHDRETKFGLRGKHRQAGCQSCHRGVLYQEKLQTACVACHRKDDQESGHKGSLGERCESCHNERSWRTSDFDHDKTEFGLKGKHKTARCEACHKPGTAGAVLSPGKPREKLPTQCVACHRADDQKVGHRGGYGDRCESCHSEKSWRDPVFQHDRDTRYPLKGKHSQAKCAACHRGTGSNHLYTDKLSIDCVACHRQDDASKGHRGGYGEKCQSCHTERAWKQVIFSHDRDTKYPLRGKHAQAACNACHRGSGANHLYANTLSAQCVACHRKDDESKGHRGQLGNDCASCHRESDWKVPRYDHTKARFALTGAHLRSTCSACHRTVAFRDAPRTCHGCHEKEDVHKRRLGEACGQCHNTRTWKSWDFDHQKTGFPLEAGHAIKDCYACHRSPMPTTGSRSVRSCTDCHREDDAHDGKFGQQCDRCHVTRSWTDLRMNGRNGPTKK